MAGRDELYLVQYREAIRRGEIIAGQELIMELDKLVADMDNPRYIYDPRDAHERIDFIQGCIRLTKSPFYGKPMTLMLWQKAFIETVYSFKMADTGFDRFQQILLLIARKNGKSETCSALALTELIIGPRGADIVCSSNDDTQASIIYDAIDTMRKMIDPASKDTWRNQQHIRCNITNSKCFKLSDKTRNKEGRNIDFAILDEVHEMLLNVIAMSIMQSQSLKDNPKFFEITTEGFVNEGYLDTRLREYRAVLNGEDTGIMAERMLPWLYTQDSEAEVWQDESTWMKSNPTLGTVKRWDYLRQQIDKARRSMADRMFVLSKDFNIKVSNSQQWLMEEDFTYPATYELEDFRGAFALAGVDLSETTDLTCAKVLLMRKDDKTKYVVTKYFIPESKLSKADDKAYGARYAEWAKAGHVTICEGNENNLEAVADWLYSLYKDYGIRIIKTGYDQRFAKEFLQRMDFYGFECERVDQNKITLSNAMKLVEADLKDRLINYNENPVDRWCLGNASMESDKLGNVMAVKINNQAQRRIDGAVTLIIVYEIFRRYRAALYTKLQ